jgi:hypothetical protein
MKKVNKYAVYQLEFHYMYFFIPISIVDSTLNQTQRFLTLIQFGQKQLLARIIVTNKLPFQNRGS